MLGVEPVGVGQRLDGLEGALRLDLAVRLGAPRLVQGRQAGLRVGVHAGEGRRLAAAGDERAAAEDEEDDDGDGQAAQQRRDEEEERVAGQLVLVDDPVGDRAEDADRREAPGGGALHDHHAHEHRVDPVAQREAHRDGSDDRDRGGADGADGGDDRADREHRPRHEGDAAADGPHGAVHDPVDGPVVLRQREEVGDPDEDHEQAGGESFENLGIGDAVDRQADEERGDEREGAHVDAPHRGDEEDECEDEERDDLMRHGRPF